MSLTAYQNINKTSRAWALNPDKTLLVSILYIKNTGKAKKCMMYVCMMMYSLFFLYARFLNIT